jgi:hypothetical protein
MTRSRSDSLHIALSDAERAALDQLVRLEREAMPTAYICAASVVRSLILKEFRCRIG